MRSPGGNSHLTHHWDKLFSRDSLMDLIKPLINEPALILEQSPNQRFVLIADLHLGIEYTLIDKGVEIPSQVQTQRLVEKLERIIERVKPTGIIILGDIKHNVPMISHMDWYIVPPFFEKFTDFPIHVILGNHESETQIEGLTTRNVVFHPAHGWLMESVGSDKTTKIALFHGHTWPGKELFNADVLVMAHNHPVIAFKDELNVRTYEPAWIRARWNREKLARAYLKYRKIKKAKDPLAILKAKYEIIINENPEIIIMPAFNDLLGGIPFNAEETKFIGPLLKSDSVNIDDAEVLLLDGTILGKIKDIRVKG